MAQQNRIVFVANNFFKIAARFSDVDATGWTFAVLHAKCEKTALVYFSNRCRHLSSSKQARAAWAQVQAIVQNPVKAQTSEDPVIGSVSTVLGLLIYDAWVKAVVLSVDSVDRQVRREGWIGRGEHARKLEVGLHPSIMFYGTIRLALRRGMPETLARFAFYFLAKKMFSKNLPNLCNASVLQGIAVGTWADVAFDSLAELDPHHNWKYELNIEKTLANAVYRMHIKTAKRHFKDVHWSELRDLALRHAQGLLSTSLTRITKREPKSLGVFALISQSNNIIRAKSVPAMGLFRVTTDELVNLAETSWTAPTGATAKAAWEGIILAIAQSTDTWITTSAMASKCLAGTNRLARFISGRLASGITMHASARALALASQAERQDASWSVRVKRHCPADHLLFLHSAYQKLPMLSRKYALSTILFHKEWTAFLLSVHRGGRAGVVAVLPLEILQKIAWHASPAAVQTGCLNGLLRCTQCFAATAMYREGTVLCVQCSP